MPVQVALVEGLHDLSLQAVAHRRDPLALGRHFLLTELASLPEPHDEGNWQGAGPHPALVAAPVDLRHQAHSRPFFPHVQGDRKSTRLNSSHGYISYAVFCLKKKKKYKN